MPEDGNIPSIRDTLFEGLDNLTDETKDETGKDNKNEAKNTETTKENERSDDGGTKEGEGEIETKDKSENLGEEKPDEKQPSLIGQARKEFKELFKKFPELERDHFEAKKFREIFANAESAKEAQENSEYFANLADELFVGKSDTFIQHMAEANTEGFIKFAMGFLPTLNEKSPVLVERILSPVINNLFAKLAIAADRRNDSKLLAAVQYCLNELNGSPDIPQVVDVAKQFKARQEQNDTRNSEATRQHDEAFYETITGTLDPAIDTEIGKYFTENIPPGLKARLIREVKESVFETLRNDQSHTSTMTTLWKAARSSNYNSEYRRKIAKEIFTSAQQIIPRLSSKIKTEALGAVRNKGNKNENAPSGAPPNNGFANRNKAGAVDPKKIDFRRTSLRDALDFDEDSSRIVLKK